MPLFNLNQLFEHEIIDLHSAETQIIEALPEMIAQATDSQLKAALQEHLEVTREQLGRLNETIKMQGFKMTPTVCQGMRGIIAESRKSLSEINDTATKDAAIISGAQKVEHYEMAAYGTTAEYARQLGLDEAVGLLEETLDEEKEADASLSALAKGGIFKTGINETAV